MTERAHNTYVSLEVGNNSTKGTSTILHLGEEGVGIMLPKSTLNSSAFYTLVFIAGAMTVSPIFSTTDSSSARWSLRTYNGSGYC